MKIAMKTLTCPCCLHTQIQCCLQGWAHRYVRQFGASTHEMHSSNSFETTEQKGWYPQSLTDSQGNPTLSVAWKVVLQIDFITWFTDVNLSENSGGQLEYLWGKSTWCGRPLYLQLIFEVSQSSLWTKFDRFYQIYSMICNHFPPCFDHNNCRYTI